MQQDNVVWRPFIARNNVLLNQTFTLKYAREEPEVTHFDLKKATKLELTFEQKCERLVKNCYLAVLQNCTNQISLLGAVSQGIRPPVTEITYKSLEERFSDKAANYDEHQLNLVYTDMDKLQKDITIIMYLLNTLLADAKYGNFDSITEYTGNMIRMQKDEQVLMEVVPQKRNKLNNLRRACVNDREHSAVLLRSLNNTMIDKVKTFDSEIAYASDEVKYVRKWHDALDDQNRLKLKRKENKFSKTTTEMHWKISLEERCHEEIKLYLDEACQDQMDEIQKWMGLHDSNLESKELEIYEMRTTLDKAQETHEQLQLEYEERGKAMKKWLEHKGKKREEEELLALQLWASIKIQAWWRGVMFRKKLGPYRKKKGKKGKDKEKNKGKGKAKKSKDKSKKA